MNDIRIGSPEPFFLDDIKTQCDRCGADIFLRPHGPMDITLLCIPCGSPEIDENSELVIPPETIDDLKAVFPNLPPELFENLKKIIFKQKEKRDA